MPPTGTSQGATSCDKTSDAACPPPPSQPFAYFSNLYYIGQHDLTYLICSDGRDLIIIDQHVDTARFIRIIRIKISVATSICSKFQKANAYRR